MRILFKMDVEIIKDEYQVIEISDEEDSKNFLTTEDVGVVLKEDEYFQNQIANTVKTQSFNKTASNNHCIFSKTGAPEVVIKKYNSQNHPGGNAIQMKITNTNGIDYGGSKTKNRRRKRRRPQKKFLNSNDSNNNELNPNVSSAIFEQASFRSYNINSPQRYDFSKLGWLRPLRNLSSPPHLQIGIIDRSHPFWRIENSKWLMVEKRLLEALNSEMVKTNNLSIGLFDGAKWQRGIKIVGCHNKNAFNFIMQFVNNLEKLWNGAQLDAFPISYLSRQIVKGYIPPPTIKTELILSLIKLQNPFLFSNDWKVVRECERIERGGIDIWISVNNESFAQLSSVRGEIKYGINRLFFNPSQ